MPVAVYTAIDLLLRRSCDRNRDDETGSVEVAGWPAVPGAVSTLTLTNPPPRPGATRQQVAGPDELAVQGG
jgi:hypothetical protein